METIYFKGTPCHTCGSLPYVGDKAPCYNLITKDLKDISCEDYVGKKVVINIFPSLDTPVCAASVRRFNKAASELENTVVLCVSMDLPFAAKRFCTTEGLENVVTGSAFRSPLFGQKYGVMIVDGPFAGLLARAVVVLDEKRNVIYRQMVEEITNEPDYEAALAALKSAE